jgi:hypothetical protein
VTCPVYQDECSKALQGGHEAGLATAKGTPTVILLSGDSQVAEQLRRAQAATATAQPPQRPRGQRQQQQQKSQINIEAENRRLADEAAAAAAAPRLAAMRATRAALPAAAAKGAVLQELQQHRVLVISGATGAGTPVHLAAESWKLEKLPLATRILFAACMQPCTRLAG